MVQLDNMFDACAAVSPQLSFPANSQSNCWGGGSDPYCDAATNKCMSCPTLAEAHHSCRITNDVFSQDADGVITSRFNALVNSAPAGCCTANSCVGAYFESAPVKAEAGEKIYFDYQAIGGSDWFEVGVGIYDAGTSMADWGKLKGCKVFRGNAMTDFTNDYFDVPSGGGNYKLGFFVGSYDRSGGTVLGATLKVKKFQMTVPT